MELKYGRASRSLLRRYSTAPPCHWLVPPLVTMLNAGPEVLPNSAEKLEVSILTSLIKSGLTLFTMLPLLPEFRLKEPSTVKLAESARLPLTTWLVELSPVVIEKISGFVTTAPGIRVSTWV